MSDLVQIKRLNEVHVKIIAEPSTIMEMSDYFTFDVPGAKFSPAYKNKMWDGKVRLLHSLACTLYVGLCKYVEKFCFDRGYKVEYLDEDPRADFSEEDALEFIKELKPTNNPRDYQLDAFIHCVRENRALLLSPTASGKSFIIYLLVRYYAARTLIIVPTTSLVSQLASDFADYGFDSDKYVHRVFAGQDKGSKKPITITTWQSVYKLPKEYFDQFDVVIGDEAHLFKAKSLTSILTKMVDCKYRFGCTGTLDGTQTNKLVLEGLFGPVKQVTTTTKMIAGGHAAKFKTKCIVLQYPDSIRKELKGKTYAEEMDWLVRCNERNKFIMNLSLSLEGNTLVLFQFVEKHGVQLHKDLQAMTDRPVYYVSGSVDGDKREEIRKICETEKNAIIVASYGTFSTGINIRNLHNLIFSSPSKSRVRILQSIGRILRLSETKTSSTLYDIADDLTWKGDKNYTLLHFMERIKTYNEEQFPYKVFKVTLDF